MIAVSPEPTGSGEPAVSAEHALSVVGQLLGASFLREAEKNICSCSGSVDRLRECGILPDTPQMSHFSLQCPSISLVHEKHTSVDHRTRQTAHDLAIALLSRPVVLRRANYHCSSSMKPQTSQGASNPVFQTDSLPQLSQQILENAYQSFTVLIDSRLRAYASFLARHAMAVADEKTNEMGMFSVEQKLETLLDVGGKITVSRVSTRFDVAEVEGVQEGDHYSFPLSFYVEMSLMIPRPLATDEMVSVAFSAPGTIAAMVGEKQILSQVSVSLNVDALLSEMMDRASCIVAAVVEIANNAFCIPEEPKSIQRGDSYLAMPPPPPPPQPIPRQNSTNLRAKLVNPLELLSNAAAELPVVSPDLSGLMSPRHGVPPLTLEIPTVDPYLEDTDDSEKGVSEFSADQCADIVDGVFGALDDAFLKEPRYKKAKGQP
ncbi:predicted protein [Phaeodactylum tricornutum CCAP 1055/1]|uniref:Uncharacterized protein n=2 Tax=Phaeodactylum tricornutum TaxID=2850 RepID=B7GBP1_PHATC|nr:predicted protein [Phaeodactylum tricornutum CCAP 1055/1]EEC43961.1 predicted protein [Phaeodactylum tricornutum CCAP 1055/1]|eukprot:XP_002184562.1 predicted protein [Phaeodactylum tricornutum CCAP 1055/1]